MSRGSFSFTRAAEVAGAGRSSLGEARRPVCLRVVVDTSCPRWLVLAVRAALVPGRGGARLVVGDAWGAGDPCDAALVLAGEASPSASVCAAAGEPTALVVPTGVVPEAPGGVDLLEVVARDEVAKRLGSWLARACPHPLAAATAFPVCRAAVCAELTRACAARNAAVAALPLGHGADLPIMCANQASLALELAAAHGRRLDVARLADVAGVCALGVLWRGCARALAARTPLSTRVAGVLMGGAGTLVTAAALALRLSLEGAPGRRSMSPRAAEPRLDTVAEATDGGYVTIGDVR